MTMLLLLFLAASAASIVDAIAGGGGLITIPALLLTGLPPVNVLATNKTQGMCGTFVSSAVMLRKKMVSLPEMKKSIAFVACGAMLGTLLVQWIDRSTLEFIIPCVLVFVTLYVLLSPKASDLETKPRITEGPFRFICTAIGMYDGALGPGTGSMYALTHVGLRGMPIRQSTARAKILNFTSNIFSFLVFLIGGHVVWGAAACMIVGQVVGGYIGAHLVIAKGTKIIKPIIAITSMAMLIKYFFFS